MKACSKGMVVGAAAGIAVGSLLGYWLAKRARVPAAGLLPAGQPDTCMINKLLAREQVRALPVYATVQERERARLRRLLRMVG